LKLKTWLKRRWKEIVGPIISNTEQSSKTDARLTKEETIT